MSKYPNFQGDQLCAQVGHDFYYVEKGGEAVHIAAHLKKVCNSCPYLVDCREWAIVHEEFGYWGGLSANERNRLRSKHKILLETPHVRAS